MCYCYSKVRKLVIFIEIRPQLASSSSFGLDFVLLIGWLQNEEAHRKWHCHVTSPSQSSLWPLHFSLFSCLNQPLHFSLFISCLFTCLFVCLIWPQTVPSSSGPQTLSASLCLIWPQTLYLLHYASFGLKHYLPHLASNVVSRPNEEEEGESRPNEDAHRKWLCHLIYPSQSEACHNWGMRRGQNEEANWGTRRGQNEEAEVKRPIEAWKEAKWRSEGEFIMIALSWYILLDNDFLFTNRVSYSSP